MTNEAPRDHAEPSTDPRFEGWEAHLGAGGTVAERAGRLDRLARDAAAAGAPAIRWWARRETVADGEAARTAGYRRTRRLHRVGRDLPVEPHPDEPGGSTTTRPFDEGCDTESWLEVNNLAFHWHPDQGGWTPTELAAKVREPWVRPDGLLVHEGPDGVDAFCFCRPHDDEDPPAGEIHIIAVHPDRHGTGLGGAILDAGLRWIAEAGYRRVFLWVEADNAPALRLYERRGFTLQWSDAAYERPLPGSATDGAEAP